MFSCSDKENGGKSVHAENWCISSLTLGISHPNLHQAVSFFLSLQLHVGLHFMDCQLCWLEILVVDFEQAIIDNKLDEWLETVYAAWFAHWPKNPYKIYCNEEKDDIAQRRQVCNDS